MYRTIMFTLGMFLTVAAMATASSTMPSTTMIALLQPIHFAGLDGKDLVAEPGTYEVVAEPKSSLQFHSQERSVVLKVQAEAMDHDGELPSPRAVVLPGEEGEYHVILLLSDGTGFEAVGSLTGIQTRGRKPRRFVSSKMNRALHTSRPAKRAHASKKGTNQLSKPSGPKLLRAVQQPSPELQKINQQDSTPSSRRHPGVQDLLNTIRNMPGGPALIDQARRDGARISQGSKKQNKWLSWFTPLFPSEAFAQTDFSVTLTPTKPEVGPNYLSFQYVNIPKTSDVQLLTNSKNAVIPRSMARTWIQVPNTGWYIVNVEAIGYCQSNPAMLRHLDPEKKGSGPFAGLKQWTDPPTQAWSNPPGQQSYPTLVQLEAGRHEFVFYSGHLCFMTFLETSVYSL